MDDLRPKPTQGWSASAEAWKDRVRALLLGLGVVSVVGVVLALVLPDYDKPSQANYERCLSRVADQSKGTAAIFYSLKSAQCDRLKP